MVRYLVSVLLAGCSFSIAPGGTTDAPAGDGPGDATDALPIDAAPIDAAPIDAAPLGAWSAPVRIVELTTTDGEDDPSLTADLLEIYFGSNRGGGFGNEDVWMASRLTASAAWGPAMNVAFLNSADTESNIRVSANGLVIFFASNRSPSQEFDLWTSTRANRLAPWGAPTRIAELATTSGEYAAHPSPDLLRLTFCSNRAGGDEDIFVTTRAAQNAAWGPAVQVSDTSTTSSECDPVDPDPTTLYFASNRPGSQGAYDIFVATRPAGGTYAAATALTVLNTPSNDRDVWVSQDQRLLVFSSNRQGGDDLYYSTR